MWFFLFVLLWLFAGWGYYDLLRGDGEPWRLSPDLRPYVLILCLLAWPVAVISRTFRRYRN